MCPESTPHREFTRVPLHIWGIFSNEQGDRLTVELDQVSLRSCFARTEEPLADGAQFHLVLTTDLDDEALHLRVEARVARVHPEGMGVEFVEMPLESYNHLKRMVLLNAPDPNVVEQEFRDHVGLKRRAA